MKKWNVKNCKSDHIAVFSRMRGNKILERLTVQDSNTPHSCDYRYNEQKYVKKIAKKVVSIFTKFCLNSG